MESNHFQLLVDSDLIQDNNQELRNPFQQLIEICYKLLEDKDIYPRDWSDLLVLRNRFLFI
jgi:hypothetical protein